MYYFDTLSMARAALDHSIGNDLDSVAAYFDKGNKLPDVLSKTKGILDLPPNLLAELGAYCNQDVDLTWEIFQEMLPEYPEDELHLIDLTIRAFTEPLIQVDKPMVQAELRSVLSKNGRLMRRVKVDLGAADIKETRIILRSDDKLATAFRDLGYEPPMKTTKKGNVKPAFAKADLEFQAWLAHPDQVVREICEARQNVKSNIAETRARRLLSHADPALPIMLNYCRAHTFRWSGGDKLNPQNFPRIGDLKNPRSGRLRKALRAPKGQKMIIVDSSQIEARMTAWVAEQQDLLDIFRKSDRGEGRDPYCHMGDKIYGYEVHKKKHPKERFVGKVAVLGLGYNMGAPKFQYTLEAGLMGPSVLISMQESNQAVTAYRQANNKIVSFWKFMDQRLSGMLLGHEYEWRDGLAVFHSAGVDMPNGLTLWYPELEGRENPYSGGYNNFSYFNGQFRSHIYGGLFTENFVQSLARSVVAEQMLRIAEKYRVVMMSHDEVVYLAPTRQAKRAFEYGLEAMRIAPDWCSDIPLNAEGQYEQFYSKS